VWGSAVTDGYSFGFSGLCTPVRADKVLRGYGNYKSLFGVALCGGVYRKVAVRRVFGGECNSYAVFCISFFGSVYCGRSYWAPYFFFTWGDEEESAWSKRRPR